MFVSNRCRSVSVGTLAVAMSACSASPSRNILGAYFPSWMLCAVAGIAGALIARAVLSSAGLLEEIPAPAVVLMVLAVAVTLGIWLLWLA